MSSVPVNPGQRPPLRTVDNPDPIVLLAALEERMGNIEHLLRSAQSPTATMQALLAMEAQVIARVTLMQDTIYMMLHRTAVHLKDLAEAEAETSNPLESIATMMQPMQPTQPQPEQPAAKGPRGARRPSR